MYYFVVNYIEVNGTYYIPFLEILILILTALRLEAFSKKGYLNYISSYIFNSLITNNCLLLMFDITNWNFEFEPKVQIYINHRNFITCLCKKDYDHFSMRFNVTVDTHPLKSTYRKYVIAEIHVP